MTLAVTVTFFSLKTDWDVAESPRARRHNFHSAHYKCAEFKTLITGRRAGLRWLDYWLDIDLYLILENSIQSN